MENFDLEQCGSCDHFKATFSRKPQGQANLFPHRGERAMTMAIPGSIVVVLLLMLLLIILLLLIACKPWRFFSYSRSRTIKVLPPPPPPPINHFNLLLFLYVSVVPSPSSIIFVMVPIDCGYVVEFELELYEFLFRLVWPMLFVDCTLVFGILRGFFLSWVMMRSSC